jgi:hypothetical protein
MALPSRIVGTLALLFGIYAFGRVGLIYLIDPLPAASRWGFEAQGIAAVTNLRAGLGGFHLAAALVLLAAVIGNRVLAGLFVFLVTTSTVVASRLVGVAIDGNDPITFRILTGELMGMGVAAAGLLFVYFYPSPAKAS